MVADRSPLDATTASKILRREGFEVTDAEDGLSDLNERSGHQKTECLECSRDNAVVRVCLHRFTETMEAIEAATELGLEEWPAGLKRINFAHGKVVVALYGKQEQEAVLEDVFDALT